MTNEAWKSIQNELMAPWYRNLSDWRDGNSYEIAGTIRDAIGDVEWLLKDLDLSGDERAVLERAVDRLKVGGAELRSRLSDDQDEWTAPILLDVIEKLEAKL